MRKKIIEQSIIKRYEKMVKEYYHCVSEFKKSIWHTFDDEKPKGENVQCLVQYYDEDNDQNYQVLSWSDIQDAFWIRDTGWRRIGYVRWAYIEDLIPDGDIVKF